MLLALSAAMAIRFLSSDPGQDVGMIPELSVVLELSFANGSAFLKFFLSDFSRFTNCFDFSVIDEIRGLSFQ